MRLWKQTTDTLHILSDKYAYRYVEQLEHRCVAFKFYIGTATFSDSFAFYYDDYATPEDAIKDAKRSLMRGELEKAPVGEEEQDLLSVNFRHTYSTPNPILEKRGY